MVIGDSVNYLGSETIPIAMTCDGIIDFYNKNKHLIENAFIKTTTKPYKLTESVVSNSQVSNYTFG